jgi:hypothetical protein
VFVAVRGRCCTLLLYGICLIGSRVGRGTHSPTFRFSGVAYGKLSPVVRVLCGVADRCW